MDDFTEMQAFKTNDGVRIGYLDTDPKDLGKEKVVLVCHFLFYFFHSIFSDFFRSCFGAWSLAGWLVGLGLVLPWVQDCAMGSFSEWNTGGCVGVGGL